MGDGGLVIPARDAGRCGMVGDLASARFRDRGLPADDCAVQRAPAITANAGLYASLKPQAARVPPMSNVPYAIACGLIAAICVVVLAVDLWRDRQRFAERRRQLERLK